MSAFVRAERRGAVLTITLDRPDRRNSLTREMMVALTDHVTSAAQDDRVGVVVLTGSSGAFSAGADIDTLLPPAVPDGDGETQSERLADLVRSVVNPMIRALIGLDKPVLAAVNGVAAGVGVSIALAADARIACSSARFIMAWRNIGLVPDGGATYLLPEVVGRSKALELAWLGETISVRDAHAIGLVNLVVDDDLLMEVTMGLADRLARGPAQAMQLTKRAMRHTERLALDAALDREASYQASAAQTRDFFEGITAFREKRPALFGSRDDTAGPSRPA
ncbi:MAG: enoyl-CoA hydratase/isomerase family protein [Candidatus Limnocylindrales bacterium]